VRRYLWLPGALILIPAVASYGQTLEECIRRRAADFRQEETYRVDGGVRCEGAGVSGKGQKRTDSITYKAAPGRRLGADPSIEILSINRGKSLPSRRSREGDREVITIPIECESPDRPFGPGAWIQVRVTGRVEAAPSGEDYLRFARECETARRDR